MLRAERRHRPAIGPAIAVEQRQRPEIDAFRRQREGERRAKRVQIGAAMMVDDTFRVAGRAARIVDRDRVPFVLRQGEGAGRIALGEQRLIFDLAESGGAGAQIVDFNDARSFANPLDGGLGHFGESGINEKNPAFGMVERIGDGRGVEADVDGVQHRSGPGHAEMSLDHRRRIGRQDRHHLAIAYAHPLKTGGQRPGAAVNLAPAQPPRAVQNAELLRIDRRGAAQEL